MFYNTCKTFIMLHIRSLILLSMQYVNMKAMVLEGSSDESPFQLNAQFEVLLSDFGAFTDFESPCSEVRREKGIIGILNTDPISRESHLTTIITFICFPVQ